jgi:hypothetical protein
MKKFIFSGPGHPNKKADAPKCYGISPRSIGEYLVDDLKHT